jgi:hypothetical protein
MSSQPLSSGEERSERCSQPHGSDDPLPNPLVSQDAQPSPSPWREPWRDDFERWQAKQAAADERTALTGWARPWDFGAYCPDCAAKIRAAGFRLNDHPSNPVKDGEHCDDCRKVLGPPYEHDDGCGSGAPSPVGNAKPLQTASEGSRAEPSPSPIVERAGVLAEISAERLRQVEVEGWTPEHDAEHGEGELAMAAGCYAIGHPGEVKGGYWAGAGRDGSDDYWIPLKASLWPWDIKWWKPSDRRHDLVKAAALIVAEIERLDRLAALTNATDGVGRSRDLRSNASAVTDTVANPAGEPGPPASECSS